MTMHILLINKYLFPKGGTERHFFALKELLEKHGHDVIVFAMEHPQNVPSPYSEYFVSRTNFEHVRFSWNGLRSAARMVWSFEAARKLDALIRATKPDIAHIHNIYHQISPSILPVLKKRGIPVVMTAHDFNLISPNYNLFHDGAICERCKPTRYYRAIFHRCVKHSYIASSAAAKAQYLHRWLGVYRKNVAALISPSKFLLHTMHEWHTKFIREYVLVNFVAMQNDPNLTPGEYFLYLGRLSPEKGVDVLLEAARNVLSRIVIAGTGPEEQRLRNMAAEYKLRNVEFLGFQSSDKVEQLLRGCRAVIAPSRGYEHCPLVVVESFAAGKPVVAAHIGGIPELVVDGTNGLLITAGDAKQLAAAMNTLATDDAFSRTLGENALQSARKCDPEQYCHKLMNIYEQARA